MSLVPAYRVPLYHPVIDECVSNYVLLFGLRDPHVSIKERHCPIVYDMR